jgi:carbon storage regulator|uniref:Translational regulator CsrA n=1 Tax=Mesoaciditoga lauensis TaxID=1495039 RepID=A0A7V3RFK3_9BACT
MLILKRKIGEAIKIGNDVTVRILSIDRGEIKIGIEAPKDVKVFREELYEEISNLNRESGNFDVNLAKEIFRKDPKGVKSDRNDDSEG